MPVSDTVDSPPDPDATRHSVHIRFAPSQGRRLRCPAPFLGDDRESLWVERPVLMERADGTYDLVGTTARPGALTRWVLSYGPDAEVTGPERLRRRVADEARRIVRQYASKETEERPP